MYIHLITIGFLWTAGRRVGCPRARLTAGTIELGNGHIGSEQSLANSHG